MGFKFMELLTCKLARFTNINLFGLEESQVSTWLDTLGQAAHVGGF